MSMDQAPDLGDDYARGRDDGFKAAMISFEELMRAYFDHLRMQEKDIMSIFEESS